jgi:PAS domain S-box-containing protein
VICVEHGRLKAAGELARDLVSGIPGAGLLIVDADLRVLLSDGHAPCAGDADAALGRCLDEVVPAAAWKILRPRYLAALAGRPQRFVYAAVSEPTVYRVRLSPISEDSVVVGLLLLSQDITAQQQGADARNLLQSTLDSLPARIAVIDDQGTILVTNRGWTACDRADGGSVCRTGDDYLAACDAADGDSPARAAAGLRAIASGRQTDFAMEYACHTPEAERWFAFTATRFVGPGAGRVVLSHSDVTEGHRAGAEAATQAALLDEVDLSVMATDAAGAVTHWNRGAQRLFGHPPSEAVGRPAGELIVAVDRDRPGGLDAELRLTGHREGEYAVHHQDGSTFPAHVRDRIVVDGDGEVAGMIGVAMDITERVASERALSEARHYMRAVADSMGEGLFTLDTDGRVIYLNPTAEALLGWSCEELRGQVMHGITRRRRADGSPQPVEECPILRACRDGVTVRVDDDLFVRRDGRGLAVSYTAAPFATADGVQGCVVVFGDISERKAREAVQQRDVDTLAWIDRLHDALTGDDFVLYAQPIVDLRTGEVVQRELLLRLVEPDGRVVSPGAFLSTAEKYGIIGDIDRLVIERAVDLAATGLAVELNLSARSIGDAGILEHIERCLGQTGADPALLVFEITETAIVEDQLAAHAFADRLHALGSKLALDDFGTGYCGFTYLKRIPVDYLKIDIEFVRDLITNPGSRHVVEAVVALAQGFGAETIAEGVENAETIELLRALGVDQAQGYFLGRPEPVPDTDAEEGPR